MGLSVRYKGVNIFLKSIIMKVIEVVRSEFELAYVVVVVEHVNHDATRTILTQ